MVESGGRSGSASSGRAAGAILIQRHVLASPANPYDTAWASFAWTPALEGELGRLEEEVPWASRMARADDPPRISGPARRLAVPEHIDRLGSAVIPVGEWTAYSIWGVVGEERVGSEWRVATHTLLMSEPAFRASVGHPEGLIAPGGEPAEWFRGLTEGNPLTEPGPVSPVEIPTGRARTELLRRARLGAIARLREACLRGTGGGVGGLAALLASSYRVLASALGGGEWRHVAVRGSGPRVSRLLRLIWLSLPFEDRVRVAYVTEQRKTERPQAHLLGLPEAEWGRYVPDGSWVAEEDEALEVDEPGLLWASLVADPAGWAEFAALDRRAEARGWSLLAGDQLGSVSEYVRWRAEWQEGGPTLERAFRLVDVDTARPGGARWLVLGAVIGEALLVEASAGGASTVLERVDDALRRRPEAESVLLVRGAVAWLSKRGADAAALGGALRCHSAREVAPRLRRELHRFGDRESTALRALLGYPGGPLELVRGALPLAAEADAVGEELVRLGAEEAEWTTAAAEALVLSAMRSPAEGGVGSDPWAPGTAGVLLELVRTLARKADGSGTAALLRALLPQLGPEARNPEHEEAAAALVRAIRRTLSPDQDAEPWLALVENLPPAWLSRPAILEPLASAVAPPGTSFAELGRTPALAELASRLARRIIETASASGLPDASVEPVLRLMWGSGSAADLSALEEKPDARFPALVQLLVAPAPLPLFEEVRHSLLNGPPPTSRRALDPWQSRLAAYSPAVGEHAGLGSGYVPARGARVFLHRVGAR